MRVTVTILLLGMTFLCLPQSRRAPDWVKQPPLSDDAYYGIGYANTETHERPRQHARKMALRDLAEKIIVSVDATSELQVLSINEQITFQMNESVKVASSNFLQGYEQLGEWTHRRKDGYYVLFRLDKATYEKNLANYYDQFFDLIDMKMDYADQQVASGHMVLGINELSAGVLKIMDELDGIIEPTYAKMLEIKKLSLIHKMEAYLTRVKFNLQDQYLVDISDPNPLAITDVMVDHITQLPIRNLEFRLTSIKGDVFDFELQRNTFHDVLMVRGFFPLDGEAIFRMSANLELDSRVRTLLDETLLSRLNSKEVKLTFLPYSIEIIANDQHDQVLANYIRVITEDLGLIEVSGSAEKKVVIDAETRLNKLKRNSYQAFFDGEIRVFEEDQSLPDYEYRLQGRSSIASSQQMALRSAYDRSIENPSEFLAGFVTYLCSK